MEKRYSLERKMLSYFGLIAAASLLITIEFVWAIREATPGPETVTESVASASTIVENVRHRMESLRNKAFLMGVVQAVVTLIVLVMFIRRITGPLQKMVEHSRAISEGDLSRTIKIHRRDEIGLVGETINGLTSNIQEIVALGLSVESSVKPQLEKLRARMEDDPAGRDQLDEIEDTLAGFNEILEEFKLFPAPLAASEVKENR
ncbi:MAG: HAMP domain-containing protein [Desulfomonile tiedjei]|nr:HAMP domain-containing protein [Desulfomonile tiedjei]